MGKNQRNKSISTWVNIAAWALFILGIALDSIGLFIIGVVVIIPSYLAMLNYETECFKEDCQFRTDPDDESDCEDSDSDDDAGDSDSDNSWFNLNGDFICMHCQKFQNNSCNIFDTFKCTANDGILFEPIQDYEDSDEDEAKEDE